MERLPHLRVDGTESAEGYTYPHGGGSGSFKTPPRDRGPHANTLAQQLRQAEEDGHLQAAACAEQLEREGIVVEFSSDPGFPLCLDSLENRQQGIELLNARDCDNRVKASVYIPPGKVEYFLKLLERYANKETKTGKYRHSELVESIGEIKLATVRSFWTDSPELYPVEADQATWWEVWLRIPEGPERQDDAFTSFVEEAAAVGIRLGGQVIRFPERLVVLAHGCVQHWAGAPQLLNAIAELRRAKEVPTGFVDLRPSEQAEFATATADQMQAPPADAPAVCLLDTGINRAHPLLEIALTPGDVLAANPMWLAVDHENHGTQMAGIALYGPDLADVLRDGTAVALTHRLESVRLLPPATAGSNDPEQYGAITQEAVSVAEVRNPHRARTVCLAITADDRDEGCPSSWSAAIDQHSAGALDSVRRLYVVASGNVRDLAIDPTYRYPDSNRRYGGIEDPGQSWNALTVGAYTDRVHICSNQFSAWEPLAPKGGLCPTSRTSLMWEDQVWPLKPDVVMEGGNYARDGSGRIDACDDLALLTTVVTPEGRLFDTMADTSAATGQAARLAAILQARYPDLWPETVRGLIVHSADWTGRMKAEFPGSDRATIQKLLRCYGYGVPSLERAQWSASNRVALVVQGELQPFVLNGSKVKSHEYHLHTLPWPNSVLEGLGAVPVTMRITLSYFIEPNPGRRGWRTKHRYQSYGLRFSIKGPTDDPQEFRRRISRNAWEDFETRPGHLGEPQAWTVGSDLRTRGSIHSDWWTATAAEMAACGSVAVYPVTGWWRERKGQGCFNKSARYSLIVSLETPETEVDIYTPIANQIGVPIVATA